MDILHALGCAACAAAVAVPVCLTCLSGGFTAVAALAGGLLVMSLVGGEA
jgi:hypothetical protein